MEGPYLGYLAMGNSTMRWDDDGRSVSCALRGVLGGARG